jgi:hypothetical protein
MPANASANDVFRMLLLRKNRGAERSARSVPNRFFYCDQWLDWQYFVTLLNV